MKLKIKQKLEKLSFCSQVSFNPQRKSLYFLTRFSLNEYSFLEHKRVSVYPTKNEPCDSVLLSFALDATNDLLFLSYMDGRLVVHSLATKAVLFSLNNEPFRAMAVLDGCTFVFCQSLSGKNCRIFDYSANKQKVKDLRVDIKNPENKTRPLLFADENYVFAVVSNRLLVVLAKKTLVPEKTLDLPDGLIPSGFIVLDKTYLFCVDTQGVFMFEMPAYNKQLVCAVSLGPVVASTVFKTAENTVALVVALHTGSLEKIDIDLVTKSVVCSDKWEDNFRVRSLQTSRSSTGPVVLLMDDENNCVVFGDGQKTLIPAGGVLNQELRFSVDKNHFFSIDCNSAVWKYDAATLAVRNKLAIEDCRFLSFFSALGKDYLVANKENSTAIYSTETFIQVATFSNSEDTLFLDFLFFEEQSFVKICVCENEVVFSFYACTFDAFAMQNDSNKKKEVTFAHKIKTCGTVLAPNKKRAVVVARGSEGESFLYLLRDDKTVLHIDTIEDPVGYISFHFFDSSCFFFGTRLINTLGVFVYFAKNRLYFQTYAKSKEIISKEKLCTVGRLHSLPVAVFFLWFAKSLVVFLNNFDLVEIDMVSGRRKPTVNVFSSIDQTSSVFTEATSALFFIDREERTHFLLSNSEGELFLLEELEETKKKEKKELKVTIETQEAEFALALAKGEEGALLEKAFVLKKPSALKKALTRVVLLANLQSFVENFIKTRQNSLDLTFWFSFIKKLDCEKDLLRLGEFMFLFNTALLKYSKSSHIKNQLRSVNKTRLLVEVESKFQTLKEMVDSFGDVISLENGV